MKKNRIPTVFRIIFLIGFVYFSGCTKEESEIPEIIIQDDLVESFDWRDSSIVTPAKQQGSYGSCGVFAAMGALESAIAIKSGILVEWPHLNRLYYNP